MTPVICYERERPDELIHLNSKKLGRITGDRRGCSNRRAREGLGWVALHVVDNASRLVYTDVLPDEKESTTAYLSVR